MIKFEKKGEPPKQAKKQDENRFDQVKEAVVEKRKKTGTAPTIDSHSTGKNKES